MNVTVIIFRILRRIFTVSSGDLTISVHVLYNYLETNNRIPWEDLRYLFGEIMYGGHITDDWDRRLCIAYLEEFMQPELVKLINFFLRFYLNNRYYNSLIKFI